VHDDVEPVGLFEDGRHRGGILHRRYFNAQLRPVRETKRALDDRHGKIAK